jgi:beta-ribofuranosylaminobenzene 5'-phosphate synthase
MIVVRAFPRLHIGLVDLGNATPRRYGGAGFMLDWCPVEVMAEPARQMTLDLGLLDQRGRRDVVDAIERLQRRVALAPMRVTVSKTPIAHIGLGTKTATLLALLTAAEQLAKARLTVHEVQALSSRGGASGVGIHGFFLGGFLVDAGRADCGSREHRPSGASHPGSVPALVTRIDIPEDWRFVLIRPRGIRYSGARETRFFHDNTPVPRKEVTETIACLYHGVVPAVLENDIIALKTSVCRMHRYGFKRRELDGQSTEVRRLFHALSKLHDCAVGMSSMGPLLYAVVSGTSPSVDEVCSVAVQEGAAVLGICAGQNRCHEIKR